MTLLAMTPVQEMPKPYAKRWAALGVLCLSLLVVVMANTSLLVAAPAMTMDLKLTSSELQWVIDGYTVPYAALMLLFGVIGDRYSRRGALVLGLLTFTGGSLAGAMTDTTIGVILARVVMGVAAAIVMPATLSLLVATFPKRERATAVTIWAATSGIAIALGPLLAGWLSESYWWGSSFLINVPITLFAIVAAVALVPPSRATDPGRIDWIGGLLSVLATSTIVYAIIEGMHAGWTGAPTLLGAIGVVAVAGFITWELRHPNPLLDVRMFRSRVLAGATLAVLLFFLVTFGAIFYVAQYLQFVLMLGPVATGVHLLPLAGAVFVGSGITQWLTPKIGMRITITAGMVVGTLAVASMVGIDTTATYTDFLPVLALLGLGIGLAVSPSTDAIMAQFPDNKLGVAGGLNDTALELGGSFGIAILGSILATSYRSGISDFLVNFPGKGPDGLRTGDALQGVAASGDSVAGAVIVSNIMRSNPFLKGFADNLQVNAIGAFVRAVTHTSLIATIVFAIGALIVGVMLPSLARRVPAPTPDPFDPAAFNPAAFDNAAWEAAELELMLARPSAAHGSVPTVGAHALIDENPAATRVVAEKALATALETSARRGKLTEIGTSPLEQRPNIYELAGKVFQVEAAAEEEQLLSDSGQMNLLRLALFDVAATRLKSAEDELDSALHLAARPVLRPAPWPSPIPTPTNFYEYASVVHRKNAELQERSSSAWAMPF